MAREMPQDVEAERAVLGAVLNDPGHLGHLLTDCPPEAFYVPRHATVAQAMAALLARNEGVDIKSTWRELQSMHRANTVGQDYLGELSSEAGSGALAAQHARYVVELAQRRALCRVLDEAIERAYGDRGHFTDLADGVLAEVMRATERKGTSEPVLLLEALEREFERVESIGAGNAPARPRYLTGLFDLDAILAPMEGGQLILLGGRPSAGKTSLVLHLARSIATCGAPVLFFSLETTTDRLARRQMAAASTKVGLRALADGRLAQAEMDDLVRAAQSLSRLPVWIDDGYELTLSKLRAKARRHKARHGLGAIVIDYIQLLQPEAGMGSARAASREQEVAALSRGLKKLAKEFDVPVLALSQLNRESEKRNDRRPGLADLRDSGQLEQDADAVLLAYALNDERTRVGVVVAKQKDGAVGEVALGFDPTRTAFRDLTDDEHDALNRADGPQARAPRGRAPGQASGPRRARGAPPGAHTNDDYSNDFGGNGDA